MKKILLTIIVVLCFSGLADAQDGNKAAKKKAAGPVLLYNPSSTNAARSKAKEAKAKGIESAKAQPSKPSLAVDKAN